VSEERSQARLLASGSLAQQGAQVTGLLAMFVIVTVLARRLSLAELGAYGLLSSLAGYLVIVQNAGAAAAVRDMAAARDPDEGNRVFSTAAALYALAGLAAGLLVAIVGVALSAAIDLPPSVRHQSQVGSLLLGAVTLVGWPLTVSRDGLRARQLFVRAAATDFVALVGYVSLVLGLVYGGASLALVIGASGTIPLLVGIAATVVARASRVPFRFVRGAVSRHSARRLLGTAGYLSLIEAFAASVYALNRAILGVVRSAATVGLFEGPIRAHNLIRSLNGAVTVVALPTAARYQADDDRRRLEILLTRGVRYTLALIVPMAVTGMVLAGPILDVWLGGRFREAGGAMAILLSHWLLSGCTGLLTAVLVALGRARRVARWAGGVALGDVVLALALTPLMGLEGVAVANSLPYVLLFPVLLCFVLREVPVGLGELVRRGFAPAYLLGAVLAALLGVLRLTADPSTLPAVAAAALAAPLAYWLAYYLLWLDSEERALVRGVLGDLVPSRRR
jgi:O-antigen/teichoic acid export membrane protein